MTDPDEMPTPTGHGLARPDSGASGSSGAARSPGGGSEPEDVTLATMQARIGTDRFELTRLLGKGGMGMVFSAFDRTRNEAVALKTLHRFAPEMLVRFKNEFRTLADVSHPNLVGLYELVEANGIWFFTMELVSGVDFVSHVRARPASPSTERPVPSDATAVSADDLAHLAASAGGDGDGDGDGGGDRDGTTGPAARSSAPPRPVSDGATLDLPRLRGSLHQLAGAIDALHAMGHLHRDIKPSNVLVTEQGRVVVLDFGVITHLGRRRRERVSRSDIAGTPVYMAPEQFVEGHVPAPSSDWYAFGTILYKALTGALPFRGSGETLVRAKSSFDPPAPTAINPSAPADLAALASALLSRDPSQRPGGAEVLRRLGAAPPETASAAETAPDGGADHDTPTGRGAELAALGENLARAREARGIAVLVRGRSGMGKSTLIRYFLAPLIESGSALVLSGRCHERETVPFKALDGLIDSACRALVAMPRDEVAALLPDDTAALARAFPVLRQIDEVAARIEAAGTLKQSELRSRAFAACRQLFRNLAQRRTLVLHIDDLQWGDTESIPLIVELVTEPAARWMVIASYRVEDESSSAAIRALHRGLGGQERAAERTRTISVEPIPIEDLTTLARDLLAAARLPVELAPRIAGEARGSPYYVHEMVRYAASRGGAIDVGEEMTLEAVIRARVAALSEPSRALLTVVSMAGWRITQSIARDVSRVQAIQRALLELRAHLFVRTSGMGDEHTIEPYHDKVRESVVATLGDEAQRDIHRGIALALDAVASDGDEHTFALAHHYFHARAADLVERTATLSRRAAERSLSALSYEQACTYFARAEELGKRAGIRFDAAFYAQQGDASARAGRMDAAAAALHSALGLSGEAIERANLLHALSKVELAQLSSLGAVDALSQGLVELGERAPGARVGDFARGLRSLWRARALARQSERTAQPSADQERTRTVVRLYNQLAYAQWFRLAPMPMATALMSSAEIAATLGPSRELSDALGLSGMAISTFGLAGPARRLVSAAVEVAQQSRDPVATARSRYFSAISESFLGNTRSGDLVHLAIDEVGHLLENQDFLNGVGYVASNQMMRGHVRSAWSVLERGLRRVELSAQNVRAAEGHMYRSLAGPVLAMLGRPEEGAEHLERYRAFIDELPYELYRRFSHEGYRLVFLVETEAPEEELEAALDEWERFRRQSPRVSVRNRRYAFVAIAEARVRALFDASSRRSMAKRIELAEDALRGLRGVSEMPVFGGHERALRAMYWRARAEPERARTLLDEAEVLAREADAPWVAYRVETERTKLAGSPDVARAHFERARRIAENDGWGLRLGRLLREHPELASRARVPPPTEAP
jgi:serine/threonine protein kinase